MSVHAFGTGDDGMVHDYVWSWVWYKTAETYATRSFMKYGLMLGLVWFVLLALLAFRRGKSPTGEWNGNDCLPSLHSFGVAFGFCVRHWLYSVAYSHYRKRKSDGYWIGFGGPEGT